MKIAIYGLSTETERNLPRLKKENIILGLLDGYQTEGEIFGYPIKKIDVVINEGVERIIIIARPGSCRAITKRIGTICRESHVELYDIRGNDLLCEKSVLYDFENVCGYTYEEVINEIDKNDNVSFDLFDTLLVRNVSSQYDVIELFFLRGEKNGIIRDNNFTQKRIAAEKKLAQSGCAPRLSEIYLEMGYEYEQAERLSNLEFSLDSELLIPRNEMVQIMDYAKKRGKHIYITSDTYYSKEQIQMLLAKKKILNYDELILSCEYETSKLGQLYQHLKKMCGSTSILHIGDDILADIECAKANGLNEFRIYSAMELLELVGGFGLDMMSDSMSDRVQIGMFAAHIFNNPFQFEKRKVQLNTSYDIGYLVCAPMIMDFVFWFADETKMRECTDILFCSRDGYLIKDIYDLISPINKSKYFLTSRISAIRAGVDSISDLEYVDGMKFSGTLQENLKCRFGIEVEMKDNDEVRERQNLLSFSEIILQTAKEKKKNYMKYIERIGLGEGKIAFFDFVAKGTSQMYIQKLISNHLCGLYFLQLEPEFMKDKEMEIHPFYSEEERSKSAIFDDYYILETILTSSEPSIEEFDMDGNPVYSNETRSQRNLECILTVQQGIKEYVKDYLKICPMEVHKINKKQDEVFLHLIRKLEIRANDFVDLTIEDPFFNRMTDITDII